MTAEQLKEIISQMTLEEKAAMCSGDDFWHTKAGETRRSEKYGIRWPSRTQKAGSERGSSWY